MKPISALISLSALLASPHTVLAANCYGPPQSTSAFEFQQVANGICTGLNYNRHDLYCLSSGTETCCTVVQAWFGGSDGSRSYCWSAYGDIIGQCVSAWAQKGGSWLWSYGGDTQNYYIQADPLCWPRNARAVEGVPAVGARVEGPAAGAGDGGARGVYETGEGVEGRAWVA